MKQIKHRRRKLRIGNPVGFSLFCLGCLAVLALLYVGIAWLVRHGSTVAQAVKNAVQSDAAPTGSAEASFLPAIEEYSPSATPAVDTPQPGTPDTAPETPSAEPTALVTAAAEQDHGAPLYGRVIGLDPGRDGSSKYLEEAAYNLEFTYKLKDYLEQRGATVVLTRTDSSATYELVDRARTLNEGGSQVVIRFMANHITAKTSASFVYGTRKNEDFCRTILEGYLNATGMSRQTGNDKKNGYENKSDDVCKKSNCPVAVLVLGNWNNETDQANFQDPAFQQKMMEGIYNGILTYWDIPVQG